MIIFLQSALYIFLLRMVDSPLYTMRIMMVARGRKAWAWIFAFFQAAVYVTAIRVVFSDLGDWGKVLGYITGFATGMVVGMWMEERVAVGHSRLRIISPKRGAEISEHLRAAGYAVTEISAQGKDGAVMLLDCNVLRKEAPHVGKVISALDPDAFITSQPVRPVQRGTWHRRIKSGLIS